MEIEKPILRFGIEQIQDLSDRYSYRLSDSSIRALAVDIQTQGYLTKDQLLKLAKWKSPRSARHILKNSEQFVVEVTGFTMMAGEERSRVESLTLLSGISWPTASAILHLFHRDPYPILDFRALWSVSLEVPLVYRFDFWWQYADFCRSTAASANVDMRTLDRALWQYSKENQKRYARNPR